jgi:hypothetical protein
MRSRVEQWQLILDCARTRTRTLDGALRIEFDARIDVGELALLAAAEQRCCEFFSFTVTIDSGGIALEVRVPDGASVLAASLFGEAS